MTHDGRLERCLLPNAYYYRWISEMTAYDMDVHDAG